MDNWVERQNEKRRGDDIEREYRIDRGRIINSVSFRRLQAKTQVHGVGESDFFRTRLTHSMEVANLGNMLAHQMHWCTENSQKLTHNDAKPWIPTTELIEAICLAHDIGHPAFGHNGEKILNYFLYEDGGFEGNGQTFRILSKLGEYSKENGHNLTRRTLLGVLKYPAMFSSFNYQYPLKKDDDEGNSKDSFDIDQWQPPKCIHDSEHDVLEFVLTGLADEDRTQFTSLALKKERLKTQYKSFDTSIMECADDIAYGVHDLEDALVMGLASKELVREKLEAEFKALSNMRNWSDDFLLNKISSNKLEDIKLAISMTITLLVQGSSVKKLDVFNDPLLDYQCVMESDRAEILENLKGFVYREVIKQPGVQTLEYKGQRIISDLFSALESKPESLLPKIVFNKIAPDKGNTTKRVIADYISMMTDNEACRLYQRLFTPEKGSIFEPLV